MKIILVPDPDGPVYRFASGRIQPQEEQVLDIPGSGCRFDLDGIQILIE